MKCAWIFSDYFLLENAEKRCNYSKCLYFKINFIMIIPEIHLIFASIFDLISSNSIFNFHIGTTPGPRGAPQGRSKLSGRCASRFRKLPSLARKPRSRRRSSMSAYRFPFHFSPSQSTVPCALEPLSFDSFPEDSLPLDSRSAFPPIAGV